MRCSSSRTGSYGHVFILLYLEHWCSNFDRRHTGPPVATFVFPQAHFIDNETVKYNLDNFCRLIFSMSFSQRSVYTSFKE